MARATDDAFQKAEQYAKLAETRFHAALEAAQRKQRGERHPDDPPLPRQGSLAWRMLTTFCDSMALFMGVPTSTPITVSATSTGDDPMDDPEFLRRVHSRLQDPKLIETFAKFDQDGSGSISMAELENVITMTHPLPTPGVVEQMVKELDTNEDGEVDIWEFSIHMQKRTEGVTPSDVAYEIDAAFSLFMVTDEGFVTRDDAKSLLTVGPTALSEDEFARFAVEMGFRDGVDQVPLSRLRDHPCWR